MNLSSLSVKRRPVKKGAFRTLFANIQRKKVRAATAAAPIPEEGDVPNLGIARALVVILVIHVVAIAGIFAHSRWFEGPEQKAAIAAKQDVVVPTRPIADAQVPLPKITGADKPYMVSTGDTYDNIAHRHGVTPEELRGLNDNMELRAGRVLRIPPSTIVAEVPPDFARLSQGSVVLELPVDEIRDAPMVETTSVATAKTAVLVRPGVRPADAPAAAEILSAPRATAVEETPRASTKKHTVKSGDTFWRIAQAHNTTPDAIMKANRISDPKKLKVGMQLLVP